MGAGMSDQIGHAENFAALQLIDERGDRAQAQRRVGRAQVQQIGIVRDDLRDAGVFAIGVKLLDLFFAIRFGGPLARGLGKNLNRVAGDFFAFEKGVADAAGDGHVRAQ